MGSVSKIKAGETFSLCWRIRLWEIDSCETVVGLYTPSAGSIEYEGVNIGGSDAEGNGSVAQPSADDLPGSLCQP